MTLGRIKCRFPFISLPDSHQIIRTTKINLSKPTSPLIRANKAAGPRKDAVAQIQHWNIDKEQGRQTQVELNSKAANKLTKTPEGGSPETAIPLVTTEVNSATEFTTNTQPMTPVFYILPKICYIISPHILKIQQIFLSKLHAIIPVVSGCTLVTLDVNSLYTDVLTIKEELMRFNGS
ncbi:unnamed protein product [Ranitomeya imitator]|uniref:Uncharacterized protein n=1 Tax=Ranitomeya imitator TaxID=111125 RepID=A0ABN9KVZ4_9NEOB|nr:unnamed protein product [Ranitomeya imitator]